MLDLNNLQQSLDELDASVRKLKAERDELAFRLESTRAACRGKDRTIAHLTEERDSFEYRWLNAVNAGIKLIN
jgi:hypothetical protein